MAKGDRAETLLREVAATAAKGPTTEAGLEVRSFLKEQVPPVVAKAAWLAGEWHLNDAISELVAAFERFEGREDPVCEVKTAVAEALLKLASQTTFAEGPHTPTAVFERGLKITQPEAFAPKGAARQDLAAPLRQLCALALAASGHRDQVRLVLPLLLDEDAAVRQTAVRALAQGGSDAAEGLLRLKALQGDAEAGVTAECLVQLGATWAERSLPFLLEFSERQDATGRAALEAIGACRTERALNALVIAYEKDITSGRRRDVLNAIAQCRREEATTWMVGLIDDGSNTEAVLAIEAMAVRKNEPAVWSRVESVAKARKHPLVDDALARAARK